MQGYFHCGNLSRFEGNVYIVNIMRRSLVLLLVTSFLLGFPIESGLAQQMAAPRKITNKVVPMYPLVARNLNLSGTVKLEAVVLANGELKSVQVKGGNPLLVQSAQNAVHEWKWEKIDHESVETVEFHFHP